MLWSTTVFCKRKKKKEKKRKKSSIKPFMTPEEAASELSGCVALWVMSAAGFKKRNGICGIKVNISGPAL